MTEERIAEMKELLTANGYSHDEIIRFCRHISQTSEVCIEDSKRAHLREKVKGVLDECRVPEIVTGREYLEESVVMSYENPELLKDMYSLYYLVGNQCGEKSSIKVEEEVKFAISFIRYNQEEPERILTKYFGCVNIKHMRVALILKRLTEYLKVLT